MKTLYKNICLMSCLLIAAFGFSSCNKDDMVGFELTGHWFGDMDMYNAYTHERAMGSEIQFYSGWAWNHGTGYEIDYYYHARPVRNDFDWEVVNQIIYLRFRTDPGLDCSIRDYHLTANYFEGYIDGYDGPTYFNLRNYDRYWNEYGYGRYSYTRADDDTDTLQVKGIRGCNITQQK